MFNFLGIHSPIKMARHFFSKALGLDYSTAVRADTSKQDFSVYPRHWYLDATFCCFRCGRSFVFSADEQRYWYEELKFHVDSKAKHCGECRALHPYTTGPSSSGVHQWAIRDFSPRSFASSLPALGALKKKPW